MDRCFKINKVKLGTTLSTDVRRQ